MLLRTVSVAAFFCLFAVPAQARQARPLDHDAYERWMYVSDTRISDDGAWAIWREDHGLSNYFDRKDFSIRMQQFFDHYLLDAPPPVWMTRGVPAVSKGRTLGLDLDTQR